MGTNRPPRKSEEIFRQTVSHIFHLNNCVWSPLLEDAKEYAEDIKKLLDEMIEQMEAETD